MTYGLEKLARFRWWVLVLVASLGPFHAFLITWLRSVSDSGFIAGIATVWRELLIAVFAALAFIEWALKKKLPAFDVLDWLIIAYGVLALAWMPFQRSELAQWAVGVRFDVMPLVFLLLCRHVAWKGVGRIVKIALIAGGAVAVFGLLHALVLPQNFLMNFGYSNQQGPYQPEFAISACQYLEHTSSVCRATSTFASPMRYGAYLIVMLGFLVPFFRTHEKQVKVFATVAAMLFTVSVVLTYSRAMWVGAAVFVCAVLYAGSKNKRAIAGIFAGIIIVGAALFWGIRALPRQGGVPPLLRTIVLRESSTSEHFTYFKESVRAVKDNPLGIGLGKVGPASIRFDQKFVTENWFLQIALEMGVLGVALFIAILATVVKKLFAATRGGGYGEYGDRLRIGLASSILGLAAAGLFIHSFEETTAVLLLFGWIGIALHKKNI